MKIYCDDCDRLIDKSFSRQDAVSVMQVHLRRQHNKDLLAFVINEAPGRFNMRIEEEV